VEAVLDQWKDHGDCRNGSGERYVRKHGYRVRTTDGTVMNLYFQRSTGLGKLPSKRWWLHSLELMPANVLPFRQSPEEVV
jgi:Family of unknown function (DUF6504)